MPGQEGEEDLLQVEEGAGDLPWVEEEEVGALPSLEAGEGADHPSLEAGEEADHQTLEAVEGAGHQTLEVEVEEEELPLLVEEGAGLGLTVTGGRRSLDRAGLQPLCCASCIPP